MTHDAPPPSVADAQTVRRRQAQQWLVAGVEQHQAGQLVPAENLYLKALAFDPVNADAVYLAGVVALQQGRAAVAVRRLSAATVLRPDHGEGANNLGVAAGQGGDTTLWAVWARRAVILAPTLAAAANNLVDALKRRISERAAAEDWPACVGACRLVLALRPTDLDTVNRMVSALNAHGAAMKAAGRLDDATDAYHAVLRLAPGVTETRYNLALLLMACNDYAAASVQFQQIVSERPDITGYRVGLARALGVVGDHAAVSRHLSVALTQQPANTDALNLLGLALMEGDRLPEALTIWQRASRLNPDEPDILCNYGRGLHTAGHLQAAVAVYRRALAIDPDHVGSHWNLSLALLTTEDYAEGWEHYEWRWKLPDNRFPALPISAWEGESVGGRCVLVVCEQGLGDSLHFIRYVNGLKALGARVVVFCPAPLRSLFAGIPAIDQAVCAVAELPECDVMVPLLSLPRLLARSGERIEPAPASRLSAPYLSVDIEKVAGWRRRLESVTAAMEAGFTAGSVFARATSVKPLRVGVVWRGAAGYANDRLRSLSAAMVAGLTDVPGVTWVLLQKDADAADLAAFAGKKRIVNLTRDLPDFTDTAAVISGLDLVISVDTAVLHLSGGLGCRTWALLPFSADWRWGRDRTDSPWYPTMRLFRQRTRGDWAAVLADVRASLLSLAAG